MPTYQYECSACAHQFEVLQSMLDKKLTQCPQCKKNALSRLIGAGSGIIFKGTGFYETDYKSKAKPAESSSGEGSQNGVSVSKEPVATNAAAPETAKVAE